MFSRSKFGPHLIIGLCMVGTVRSMADPPAPLPPPAMAYYQQLEAKKIKRLRGHHQLAEYIALRRAVLQDNPPSRKSGFPFPRREGAGLWIKELEPGEVSWKKA